MNWEAIGAIAAVFAVIATLFLAWRGGTRSIVVVKTASVAGIIGGHEICASKIILKNRGSHVANAKLRISHTYRKVESYRVSKAGTIDAKAIIIEEDGNDLLLVINDLPSGEEIEIDVFSLLEIRAWQVIGGSTKFLVMTADKFVLRRLIILTVGAGVSALLISLLGAAGALK